MRAPLLSFAAALCFVHHGHCGKVQGGNASRGRPFKLSLYIPLKVDTTITCVVERAHMISISDHLAVHQSYGCGVKEKDQANCWLYVVRNRQ